MDSRPPVEDWSVDFDHFDPQWTENPFPIWDDLRSRCPVATTQRFEDGGYFASRYEHVREIAYDSEHFSSRRPVVREHKLPPLPSPPITSDPPEHTPARKLLLPAFAPKQIAKLEGRTRAICRSLLDAIGDAAECDGAVDYAQHIPVRVIALMLGVPEQDGDLFRRWIYMALIEGVRNPPAALQATAEMHEYFNCQVELRRSNPGNDLVSFLLAAQLDGRPLGEAHMLGTLRLILIAEHRHHLERHRGVAVASRHACGRPCAAGRRAGLIPTAIEEFLRAYSPVTMAREVVKETTLGGCPFKVGGQVLLSFPAANRDPGKFPDADRVLIDRAENPHAAFGLGRHRCLGSNLARMEMTVAVEEWLARFPDFSVTEGGQTTWSEGTVRGPRRLPISIRR